MERALYVLGTASQVPTATRNHQSFFVRWDREGVLFDPGEGTQRQMTLAGLAASDITRICLTHFHGDHCLGLPGVIQRLSLDAVPWPIPVHYPASGQVYFERLRRASIFVSAEHLVPSPIHQGGVIAEGDDYTICAEPLQHGVDCFGYRIQEMDRVRFVPELLAARGVRGPAVGRLQREGRVLVEGGVVRRGEVTEINPGQALAFVMDTAPCEGAASLARGVDALVCESTFLDEDAAVAAKSGHMTARQAGRLAAEAGARLLVLTHFSQRHPDAAVYLEEASQQFPNTVAAQEPELGSARHRVAVPSRIEPSVEGALEVELEVDGELTRWAAPGRLGRARALLEDRVAAAREAGSTVGEGRIWLGERVVFGR